MFEGGGKDSEDTHTCISGQELRRGPAEHIFCCYGNG